MPYRLLLRSVLDRFESRGESASSARFAASAAATALLTLNLVTITLFAHAFTGARWFRIFQSVPLNIAGILALIALHWYVIGRMQQQSSRSADAVGRSSMRTGVPLWVWYLVSSVALLFLGAALAIQR